MLAAPAAFAQGPPSNDVQPPVGYSPPFNPGGNPGATPPLVPVNPVQRLQISSWSSSYTTVGGGSVQANVRLNGASGSYLNGQGQLYGITYQSTPQNPNGPAPGLPLGTIRGRWSVNGQSGSFQWTVTESFVRTPGPNPALKPGPPKFSGNWQFDTGGGGVWNGNLTSNIPATAHAAARPAGPGPQTILGFRTRRALRRHAA